MLKLILFFLVFINALLIGDAYSCGMRTYPFDCRIEDRRDSNLQFRLRHTEGENVFIDFRYTDKTSDTELYINTLEFKPIEFQNYTYEMIENFSHYKTDFCWDLASQMLKLMQSSSTHTIFEPIETSNSVNNEQNAICHLCDRAVSLTQEMDFTTISPLHLLRLSLLLAYVKGETHLITFFENNLYKAPSIKHQKFGEKNLGFVERMLRTLQKYKSPEWLCFFDMWLRSHTLVFETKKIKVNSSHLNARRAYPTEFLKSIHSIGLGFLYINICRHKTNFLEFFDINNYSFDSFVNDFGKDTFYSKQYHNCENHFIIANVYYRHLKNNAKFLEFMDKAFRLDTGQSNLITLRLKTFLSSAVFSNEISDRYLEALHYQKEYVQYMESSDSFGYRSQYKVMTKGREDPVKVANSQLISMLQASGKEEEANELIEIRLQEALQQIAARKQKEDRRHKQMVAAIRAEQEHRRAQRNKEKEFAEKRQISNNPLKIEIENRDESPNMSEIYHTDYCTDGQSTNLKKDYMQRPQIEKKKTRGRSGKSSQKKQQSHVKRDSGPASQVVQLKIEDIISGKPYKVFCNLFAVVLKESRSKISLQNLETLLTAIESSATQGSIVLNQQRGNGSHSVMTLNPEHLGIIGETQVMTIAHHTYLKPYQIVGVVKSLFLLKLYPSEYEDKLANLKSLFD